MSLIGQSLDDVRNKSTAVFHRVLSQLHTTAHNSFTGSMNFITLLLLLSAPLSMSYICLSNTTPHPIAEDCQLLIDGLSGFARMGRNNRPILYSRRVPSSYSSGHMPFHWQIQDTTRPPNTCQITVDSQDEDPWAEEYLILTEIIVTAQIVLTNCLVLSGQIGYMPVGRTKRLVVLIQRAQPVPGPGVGKDQWKELTVVNGTELLEFGAPHHVGEIEVS